MYDIFLIIKNKNVPNFLTSIHYRNDVTNKSDKNIQNQINKYILRADKYCFNKNKQLVTSISIG